MNFSTKTRYGLRFMLYLALHYENEQTIQLKQIASAENISVKYLEQIIILIKSSGLINGIRGSKGGYKLTRPPEQINLKEIIYHLSGNTHPGNCLDTGYQCEKKTECVFYDIWTELNDLTTRFFESITLADLIIRYKEKNKQTMFFI